VSDRPVHQRGRDSRIHSTGQTRYNASALAKLMADTFDLVLDNGFRRPIATTSAHREKKITQYLRAERRVGNFRMKLDTVDAARLIFHRVECIVSQRSDLKSWWHLRDVIAMAHPNVQFRWQALKQATR